MSLTDPGAHRLDWSGRLVGSMNTPVCALTLPPCRGYRPCSWAYLFWYRSYGLNSGPYAMWLISLRLLDLLLAFLGEETSVAWGAMQYKMLEDALLCRLEDPRRKRCGALLAHRTEKLLASSLLSPALVRDELRLIIHHVIFCGTLEGNPHFGFEWSLVATRIWGDFVVMFYFHKNSSKPLEYRLVLHFRPDSYRVLQLSSVC